MGFGNDSFFSTEFEKGKNEYRIQKLIIPKKINSFYIRIWVFKRVFIISTNHGLEFNKKNKNKFKFLFGISGINKK